MKKSTLLALSISIIGLLLLAAVMFNSPRESYLPIVHKGPTATVTATATATPICFASPCSFQPLVVREIVAGASPTPTDLPPPYPPPSPMPTPYP